MEAKKPKIIYLNKYSENGASSRMRSYQFQQYFTPVLDVEYLPLFTTEYLNRKYTKKSVLKEVIYSYFRRFTHLFKLFSADVVWIEKEAFPYLPFFLERLVFMFSKKVIVDYDDAIFHNYDAHRLPLVRLLLGNKIDKIMAKANLVVSGNPYIAERAKKAGAKAVEIVPTVIPMSRFPKIEKHPENNPLIIGWIGTPMTQKFLTIVEPILDEIYKNIHFKLHLIGVSEDFWKEKPYRVRIQWSNETEAPELGKIDIGIMPLYDDKFERGKCGFKLIQYMGCSKPHLSSPVGVNAMMVDQGVNGFSCITQDEWRDHLLTLLSDKNLRQKMGETGRVNYEKNYTQEAWGPRLAQLALNVIKQKD